MSKKSKPKKLFTKEFKTAGDVSPDGTTVRMTDGSVFKRTVLPSKYSKQENVLDLDGLDALTFREQGGLDEER